MKKSLLTLSLLVAFAPAVVAVDDQEANATEPTTTESTPRFATSIPRLLIATARNYISTKFGNASNYIKTNKLKCGLSLAGLSATGAGAYWAAKNPRSVRSALNITKRFGRRSASFVNAHKAASAATVAGLLTLVAAVMKREAIKEACKKGWANLSNKCSDLKARYWNKAEATTEEATTESAQ
jgi:hypothetical protein